MERISKRGCLITAILATILLFSPTIQTNVVSIKTSQVSTEYEPSQQFRDVAFDLIYIYVGGPADGIGYCYLDVIEVESKKTAERLEFHITVNGGIPTLNETTFWTVLMDEDNDPSDNCPDYPTNDADTMYSVVYNSATKEWKIERAAYKTWGWDVEATDATWGMTSAWPDGFVAIHILVPLTELPELGNYLAWKVKTESFNGISIGDLVPDMDILCLQLEGPFHDLTVSETSVSKTIVSNEIIYIAATIRNNGDIPENVTINASYVKMLSSYAIGTQTVQDLSAGDSVVVAFRSNTTLLSTGIYTINLTAIQAKGETNIIDNYLFHYITKTISGDLNGGYAVNIIDIAETAKAYGSSTISEDINEDGVVNDIDLAILFLAYESGLGDPNWDQNADVNEDGKIDEGDVTSVTQNLGWLAPYTWNPAADMDFNGLINIIDIARVAIYYGNDSTKTKKDLEEVLSKVRLSEAVRLMEYKCDLTTAIIMKYLRGKGFDVHMGRGTIKTRPDEPEAPHAWVVVKVKEDGKDKEYIIETQSATGKPYIAQNTADYTEKERWDYDKVYRRYKKLLDIPNEKLVDEEEE